MLWPFDPGPCWFLLMQLVVESFEVGAKSFVFPVTSVIKAEEVVQVKTQPRGRRCERGRGVLRRASLVNMKWISGV